MMWLKCPIKLWHLNRNSVLCPALCAIKTQYCKVPKFWDTRNLCCNLPKIQTKRPNLRVFDQKDVNGIANSKDPDQTAPLGADDLGLHCLPRPICPKTKGHYGKLSLLSFLGLKTLLP